MIVEVHESLEQAEEELDSLWSSLESVHAAVRDNQAFESAEAARRAEARRVEEGESRQRVRKHEDERREREERRRREFELNLATAAVVLVAPGLVASVYGASVLEGHATVLGLAIQMGLIALLSALLVALYGGVSQFRRMDAPFHPANVTVSTLTLPLHWASVCAFVLVAGAVVCVTWNVIGTPSLRLWEQVAISAMSVAIAAVALLLGPALRATKGFSESPRPVWLFRSQRHAELLQPTPRPSADEGILGQVDEYGASSGRCWPAQVKRRAVKDAEGDGR